MRSSEAVPTVGPEARPCPGLLREEVDDEFVIVLVGAVDGLVSELTAGIAAKPRSAPSPVKRGPWLPV